MKPDQPKRNDPVKLVVPAYGYRIGQAGVLINDADPEYALVEINGSHTIEVMYEDLRTITRSVA